MSVRVLLPVLPCWAISILLGLVFTWQCLVLGYECTELPKDQRRISLKLKKHNSMLYYEISNPYEEKHLHRARGNYHGFGLKNVAKCVEKYRGKLDVSKSNGVFRVVAHMNSL